jgi:hypothetical protein
VVDPATVVRGEVSEALEALLGLVPDRAALWEEARSEVARAMDGILQSVESFAASRREQETSLLRQRLEEHLARGRDLEVQPRTRLVEVIDYECNECGRLIDVARHGRFSCEACEDYDLCRLCFSAWPGQYGEAGDRYAPRWCHAVLCLSLDVDKTMDLILIVLGLGGIVWRQGPGGTLI